MNIAKQHQEFKIRANKVDSNHYEDLKPSQIDSFLNGAATFIVEHFGELGKFQDTQFRKDLFGTLLVKYPDQPELLPDGNVGQQYEFKLSNLKYDYHHLDSAYVQCGNTVVPITMMVGDQIQKRNDTYQKPSFRWKRLLGEIAKSSTGIGTSLYVYSDVTLNASKKLRIEYVKQPRKVFFGYYDSIEYIDCKKREDANVPVEDCNQYYKNGDSPVDSDLPSSVHDLQVDVAVWLSTGKTENQFINQFITNKFINLPQ